MMGMKGEVRSLYIKAITYILREHTHQTSHTSFIINLMGVIMWQIKYYDACIHYCTIYSWAIECDWKNLSDRKIILHISGVFVFDLKKLSDFTKYFCCHTSMILENLVYLYNKSHLQDHTHNIKYKDLFFFKHFFC